MKTVYLCLNVEKPDSESVSKKLRKKSSKYEIEVVEEPNEADCIVTIGGDGTFLYGAKLALQNSCSLAGINLGRFGFLPSFNPDNVEQLFYALNETSPSDRNILEVETSIGSFASMNEIVLERKRVQRAARISMISSPPNFARTPLPNETADPNARARILNEEMNEVINEFSTYSKLKEQNIMGPIFVCDGVIVATPLGSTAYSSSAGGPAISPYSDVMSVTLTSLHHPRIPPVVLSSKENLYLQAEEECVLVCDGRHVGDIAGQDVVRVRVGNKKIQVYERPASVVTRLAQAFGAEV